MDLARLGRGQKLASVSALLLFGLMFLDWFGTKSSVDSFGLFSVGRSAWEALDYIPVVLTIASVAALAATGLRLFRAVPKTLVPANAVAAVLGLVSASLIFFRIVDPPNFGSLGHPFGPIVFEGTAQYPIFLAFLAAAGITFGACWALREEGVSFASLRGQDRNEGQRR